MSASTVPASSAGNTTNHSVPSSAPPPSLKRKLELLEDRFTQPLGVLSGHQQTQTQTQTHSVSPTHPNQQQQQQHHHHHYHHHHQEQEQQHEHNSDGSEHSFRFSGGNVHSHGNTARSNPPTMTVRSKRSSGGNLRQLISLDMVHRAAAEHMRKVASSSPLLGLGLGSSTSGTFSLSGSNIGGSPNNSQQTVVTGNRTMEDGVTTANNIATTTTTTATATATACTTSVATATATATPPQPLQISSGNATATATIDADGNANGNANANAERVVAESPPVLISPARGSTGTKPSVARALPISQTQTQTKTAGSATKRKSVPKRKISSIHDTLIGQATSPIKPIAHNNHHNNTASERPSTRSPRPSHHQHQNHHQHNNTHLFSEHSRDRSNNSNIGNKKPKVLLPPANNKKIHDFFAVTHQKKVHQHQTAASTIAAPAAPSISSKTATLGNKNHHNHNHNHNTAHSTATTNSTANTVAAPVHAAPSASHSSSKRHWASSSAPAPVLSNTSITSSDQQSSSSSSSSSSALLAANALADQWQARCARLQQKLHDKDEQLKAVTGNKTILHTALQQALTKARTELANLQESSASRDKKVRSVLEESLGWKFETRAKELRAKLSADGNRLGRIVSTRAGMRVIDTWEEGYAAKDWQLRKERWKRKRTALLEKQDALKQKLKAQQRQGQSAQSPEPSSAAATSTTATTSAASESIDPPLSPLEVQEAQESIQMHLEALLREEKELLAEEQTLNDEKGAHIRALKRVASEDGSRFKTRAKLNDRYVLDCLLGKGGFSEVWKAYDLTELREVAVKIHQLDPRWPDVKKENYTKHVSREYEIHRNVRHPRIVSLYDVFEIDNNSFATVLECCQGTDLDTLLKRKKRVPERTARAILLQILRGMNYLSQPASNGSRQGIIHYDLKPGNILFDEFGDAKITDFGLSKIVDTPDPAESMELTSQGAGTYWYLPPECFVTGEQVRISNKVDVWSIGVIFYQMLYGQRPFGEGKSQDKLLADHTMLNAQEVHLPDKPGVSDLGKEFVKQCLVYDQAFRPTIAQLCEHPYVLRSGP
eukprot:CAMPEP_0172410516 /NCGR_PEP_ID=MMETSP1061-20121228/76922_1 /TAXON_ID=37318 /ORGANISM="Pseudo-nitzschia pungens, Strain cf. pungens" /LENGTH=1058 /DNA_ID=CAMNT_0013146705 /DNA_START=98 /DNA_END=3274 /DNA_ORIENTATION=+